MSLDVYGEGQDSSGIDYSELVGSDELEFNYPASKSKDRKRPEISDEVARAVLRTPDYIAEQALEIDIDEDQVYRTDEREVEGSELGQDALRMFVNNELEDSVNRIATNCPEFEEASDMFYDSSGSAGAAPMAMDWGASEREKAESKAKDQLKGEVLEYIDSRIHEESDGQITGGEIKEIFGEVVMNKTNLEEQAESYFMNPLTDRVPEVEISPSVSSERSHGL